MKIIKCTEEQYKQYINFPLTEGFDYTNKCLVIYRKKEKWDKGKRIFAKYDNVINNFSQFANECTYVSDKGKTFYFIIQGAEGKEDKRFYFSATSFHSGELSNDEKKRLLQYCNTGYAYDRYSKNNTREEYDENDNLVAYTKILPYSKLIAYNIFSFSPDFAHTLKHGEVRDKSTGTFSNVNVRNVFDFGLEQAKNVINKLLGSCDKVDIITYIRSSSSFNHKFANGLKQFCGNAKILTNIIDKDLNNLKINKTFAKNSGINDVDLNNLVNQAEFLIIDEEIRSIINKMNNTLKTAKFNERKPDSAARVAYDILLKYNIMIEETLKNSKTRTNDKIRRPSDVKNTVKCPFVNQEELNNCFEYNESDGTWHFKIGNNDIQIKSPSDCIVPFRKWQIKSIYDKYRYYITNLYKVEGDNDELRNNIAGKNIIVIDDNISSGITLDNYCIILKKMGADMIIPLTFGDIGSTAVSRDLHREIEYVDGLTKVVRYKDKQGKTAEKEVSGYDILQDKKSGKYYYHYTRTDSHGNTKSLKKRLFNIGFDKARKFNYGFARVYLKKYDGWNYVDKNGNILWKGEWFKYCEPFKSNAAVVWTKNSECKYITKQGKLYDSEEFQNKVI